MRVVPIDPIGGDGIQPGLGPEVDAPRGDLRNTDGHRRVVGPFPGREAQAAADHPDLRVGGRVGELVPGAERITGRGGQKGPRRSGPSESLKGSCRTTDGEDRRVQQLIVEGEAA